MAGPVVALSAEVVTSAPTRGASGSPPLPAAPRVTGPRPARPSWLRLPRRPAGLDLPGDAVLHAVTALRWGVLVLGLSVASAERLDATLGYAVASAVLVFNATWRTVRPVELGVGERPARVAAGLAPDVVVAAVAVVATGGWSGPYALAAVPAVLLASYAGGGATSSASLAAAVVPLAVGATLHTGGGASSPASTVAVLAVVAAVGLAAGREGRRSADAQHHLGDMWLLNRLLASMHRLTRSSSVSLDLDEVIEATRDRIWATFDLSSLVIASYGVAGDGWRVVLADGELPTGVEVEPLAALAGAAVERRGALLGEPHELAALHGASGMCQPLLADDVVVGAVLVEHREPGRYTAEDLAALRSLSGPVALAIDNARWFRRIRTVAADEERVRIARELHDGVAQALVSVHLDLGAPDGLDGDGADRARTQVESALVSLRTSLIDLRAGVTASTPLAVLAEDAVRRLEDRTGARCHLELTEGGEPLPPRVEHEVWRILQEALANVERHAQAATVTVRWSVGARNAGLVVADDGVGFDTRASGAGEFGLRGMVERADAIGASLRIDSRPGRGTQVSVRLPR